jgi:hypothetical protein
VQLRREGDHLVADRAQGRDRLVTALREKLPECRVEGVAAGLHLLVRLPRGTDEAAVVRRLADHRIRIRGLAGDQLTPVPEEPALVVGSGRLPLAAGEPADARLRVEGDPEFGPRVAAMYRGWAHERGMRLEVLEERSGRRFRWLASVSGFGALRVLALESGFHVLELPDGRGGYDRRRVRVTVTPEGGDADPAGRATIVRRYRERPTPLVRDAARGWRTGRLDAVLAGGFDLVE